MIITFQSRAAGDIVMFGEIAQQMMRFMGKDVANKGIITLEQLPEAIARLRAAVAADKAQRGGAARPAAEQTGDGMELEPISLAQRAVPLIEMLELSLKKNQPVVWGI
jgi:Domain of unknown function (DUF1840)